VGFTRSGQQGIRVSRVDTEKNRIRGAPVHVVRLDITIYKSRSRYRSLPISISVHLSVYLSVYLYRYFYIHIRIHTDIVRCIRVP